METMETGGLLERTIVPLGFFGPVVMWFVGEFIFQFSFSADLWVQMLQVSGISWVFFNALANNKFSKWTWSQRKSGSFYASM